ncbi:MAG: DUF2141 domain-containing protein [Bacteroidota bacterium]
MVQFDGLDTRQGHVRIAVFNTQESFLSQEFFTTAIVKVDDLPVTRTISLPPGDYAISAYHDINDDEELNLSLLGIPKEPYGFSNNPRRGMGPASFEEASFRFNKNNQTLVIELK